jgi:membrane protein DedA with SNARE-associated domain
MTEWLLPLVPAWGLWLVAATTFLSCLALPVPASLVMLSAGGFAATGDLVLWQVAAAAFAGAVAGDHAGFMLGRQAGAPLIARLTRAPGRAAAVARARETIAQNATGAVFLSRWLLSPLGPYVNLAGGAAGLPFRRFTPPEVAGEALWVGIYTGLGYIFAERIVALGAILGNLSGALAAAAVAVVLGMLLRGSLSRARSTGRGRR